MEVVWPRALVRSILAFWEGHLTERPTRNVQPRSTVSSSALALPGSPAAGIPNVDPSSVRRGRGGGFSQPPEIRYFVNTFLRESQLRKHHVSRGSAEVRGMIELDGPRGVFILQVVAIYDFQLQGWSLNYKIQRYKPKRPGLPG